MVFLLSQIKKKNVLVLTHSGADVDAIASAAAIFFALKKHNMVMIGIPEHISLPAKAFAENMGIPYSLNPSVEQSDFIIMVDFNGKEMLGKMQEAVLNFSGKRIVVDHHEKNPGELLKKSIVLIDEKAVSCSLVVFDLLKKSSFPITPAIAKCIAAGIAVDSAHFSVADARAFSAMAECLKKCRCGLPELLALFRVKKDVSEKIASLKAAKRARIYSLGGHLVVTAEVSAFEADAASALVRIGADIAFAGGIEKGELRISSRANNLFLKNTGLDLAKIMNELGKCFEGEGGGHEGAAGFNGKAESFASAAEKCVRITLELLKKTNPKIGLREYA